jgi:hypothetical protein
MTRSLLPDGYVNPPTPADIRALERRLDGTVIVRGDDGWNAALTAWRLPADGLPALVVRATSSADVWAALDFAQVHGLRVVPRGAASVSASLGDTLLLEISA